MTISITSDYHWFYNILEDIARTPGAPWVVLPGGKPKRSWKQRKQKRGCRAGPLARLKRRPFKPPLPSLFLSNARSIGNKIDELRLRIAANKCFCDCCVLLITETWLKQSTPDSALHQLQDCFESTDWSVFEHQDLQEYTSSVLSYINFCVNSVTVDKRLRVYSYQKPWMTKEVKALLRQRDDAFRSGDGVQYSTARADLKRSIRDAKTAYRRKVEDYFTKNNTCQVWQGLQHLTHFKSSSQVWQGLQHLTHFKSSSTTTSEGDARLAEELNHFCARFEVKGHKAATARALNWNSSSLTVQEHEVMCTLRAVNPWKAAGPDGVTGRVLRECADQLAGVFTRIFNESLSQSFIPPCLKSATIVPLPKKTTINSLNDYRPVALTPVVMKCFEKLVRRHITSCLPPTFDPLQFAYRANRSTEDAICTVLHATISPLEQQGHYARLLFVDFSSAFNTILPNRLTEKLLDIGLPATTCCWITDFLSNRVQRVRVGPHLSTVLSLNIGSPQGCVLTQSSALHSVHPRLCQHPPRQHHC